MPKQDLILTEKASEELLFYEKKVLSTLCLLKCKFSQPDFVSADEFVHREQLFLHETFEAYNYLQLCYYQVRHFLTIKQYRAYVRFMSYSRITFFIQVLLNLA